MPFCLASKRINCYPWRSSSPILCFIILYQDAVLSFRPAAAINRRQALHLRRQECIRKARLWSALVSRRALLHERSLQSSFLSQKAQLTSAPHYNIASYLLTCSNVSFENGGRLRRSTRWRCGITYVAYQTTRSMQRCVKGDYRDDTVFGTLLTKFTYSRHADP